MQNRDEQGWFQSNWGWVVGCGCLLPVVLGLAVIGLGYFGTSAWIENASVFPDAMDRLRAHPAAIAALGEPIESHLTGVNASLHISDVSSDVDATFEVSGPEGRGRLHVIGEKHGDEWELLALELTIDGGQTIDLLVE